MVEHMDHLHRKSEQITKQINRLIYMTVEHEFSILYVIYLHSVRIRITKKNNLTRTIMIMCRLNKMT